MRKIKKHYYNTPLPQRGCICKLCKMREYKGCTIFPAEKNTSGIKYYCRKDGNILRADSLIGIKRLIDCK